MNILVLNGSPRLNGNTVAMINAFQNGAVSTGHNVKVIHICQKNIHGCLSCEYCHEKGNGVCIQKDDMTEIYDALYETDMLVLASPIYYHGISGQLKCCIDRFYSMAYPKKPERLSKISMFLSSGDPDMYEGALFSFKGDFLDYLGLENMGVLTSYGQENKSKDKLKELN